MNTKNYLAAVRRTTDTGSDYAVAKAIGVSRQAVSRYLNEGTTLDDSVAVRVAEILDLDPSQVILDVQIERASDQRVKTALKKIAERLSTAAASVALALTLSALPDSALAGHSQPSPNANSVYYVKSRNSRILAICRFLLF